MFDHVNDTVAAELRAAVGRKHITGAQVARNLDVPKMYVSRRLSANVDISVADLVRLSRAIGVEPLDILAQVLTSLDQMQELEAAPVPTGT